MTALKVAGLVYQSADAAKASTGLTTDTTTSRCGEVLVRVVLEMARRNSTSISIRSDQIATLAVVIALVDRASSYGGH